MSPAPIPQSDTELVVVSNTAFLWEFDFHNFRHFALFFVTDLKTADIDTNQQL